MTKGQEESLVSFQDALKRAYPQERLSSFLPYDRFDPQTNLFFNQRSLGFVIETIPLVGCTEEMQREVSGLFKYLLPEGATFQCLLWSDPNLDSQFQKWEDLRSDKSPVLKTLAKKRVSFLKSLIQNPLSSSSPRTFRIILSVSMELKNFSHQQSTLIDIKDQLGSLLKGLGLPAWEWGAGDLITFLSKLLNTGRQDSPSIPSWNPFDSLSSQISTLGSLLRVEKEGLHFSPQDITLRTYTVTKTPPFWSLYAMHELLGDMLRPALNIPVPFFFHYGVVMPKQSVIQGMFLTKATWVERQVQFGNMRSMLPHLKDEAEEIGFVRSQIAQGERMVKAQWTAGILAPSSYINKANQAIQTLFRSKLWELTPNRYLHFPSFLNALPMSWGEGCSLDMTILQNIKTTMSSEAANVLPLQGEWQGTPTPGMLLIGRRGQVFTWSPFDNTEGGFNVAVVGRSGSGKSVFMQELMSAMLGAGSRVFVMDIGRSFEKLCEILGGQYIEFTHTTQLSLNPFTGLEDLDEKALGDALAMLKPILSLMAAPLQGTSDMENAILEKTLYEVWRLYGKDSTITKVAQYLLENGDPLSQKLGTMLFPYTESGMYGRYFKGVANVSFQSNLVVIELEELKERKDLQAVVVQMVVLQISKQMFCGDRETPFTIIFDEAWDLLQGTQGGAFIENLARRVRKYNGSLVVGTQSVNDFFTSPAAQAAYDNTDWMALLSQKQGSIAVLKESKRLGVVDPTMETLLNSVKNKQGEYAEAMIYGPHGYAIGRLILDPFSRILYSTKAQEFAAVKSLQAKGVSIEDAVEKVAVHVFGRKSLKRQDKPFFNDEEVETANASD